jgi:hypothetical protein
VSHLLGHSNLDFEEACLRYYEKDRAVRTASSEQVRQPIYRDALNLWERYQEHLDPLASLLDERGVPR